MSEETNSRPAIGTGEHDGSDFLIETTPTIRPELIWFGTIFVIATVVLSYFTVYPTAFGDRELTQIVFWVLFLIFGAVLLRFAVKMFILTRTRYIVTREDIRREFEFLYRRHSRELPMEKIRGIQFNQSRIQNLLGYGTLSFLAGGTNQSLGFVEFEHLREPDRTRERIRDLISQQPIRHG